MVTSRRCAARQCNVLHVVRHAGLLRQSEVCARRSHIGCNAFAWADHQRGDTSVALAVASAVRLLGVAYIVTFCLSHRHRLAGSGFHRFGCGAAADRFPKTFSDVHTFAHLHVMCAGVVARVGRSVC